MHFSGALCLSVSVSNQLTANLGPCVVHGRMVRAIGCYDERTRFEANRWANLGHGYVTLCTRLIRFTPTCGTGYV